MEDWFAKKKGLREAYRETAGECAAIVERLGGAHHASHVDLAGALCRESRFDEAEAPLRRAMDLGYPLPGLALNYLACIARARGDIARMKEHLDEALRLDPWHPVVQRNGRAVKRWVDTGGDLPELVAHHDFVLLERPEQPTLPGALPPDFATFE